jgi:hypothetical protein
MPDSEPSTLSEATPGVSMEGPRIVARPVPRGRNQLFLVTLATVITSIFVAVMAFAFIFHYAAAHHTLAHM